MVYHCFYDYRNDIINLVAGSDPGGYYVPNGVGYGHYKSVPGIFINFIFISGGHGCLVSRTIIGYIRLLV